MADLPVDGDVLIRSRSGVHYLSIVPHPDRLSFGSLDRAIRIAQAVAATAKRAEIWHERGQELRKILREDSQGKASA